MACQHSCQKLRESSPTDIPLVHVLLSPRRRKSISKFPAWRRKRELRGRKRGVYSHANLLRGKHNSLPRGPVAELLCVVGEDYTPSLQDLTWFWVCVLHS